MNIQEPFIITTDLIQEKVSEMHTKAEILTYLAAVKDYIGSTMKITRSMLKGMK